ncbi:MAG: NAD(P)/FAD-dependent oxidoreductase [Dehalococcoidia bacterium]
MFDAIIIGARCAGSPLGMLLAKAGHNVLVVDRAAFPSDTLSTAALTGEAVPMLMAWGVYDKLKAAGTPEIWSTVMKCQDTEFVVPHGVIGPGMAPRRTVLDTLLVEAAREAGAEVREEFSVTKLLKDADGVVVGIEGHGADGEPVSEHAKIVVGADGRNSFVARHVDAPKYKEKPAVTCGYYSYFSGVGAAGISIDFLPDRVVFVFPSNHGQTCLGVETKTENWDRYRADIEGFMGESFAAAGKADLWAKAVRVERWMGANKMDNFYRTPYGPGWALVGDAGYLKDPVLGQGINDAFRDATALAGALDAAWSGKAPLNDALAAYQKQRDDASGMFYEMNHLMSQMNVTPQHLQMMQMGIDQQIGAQKAAAPAAG